MSLAENTLTSDEAITALVDLADEGRLTEQSARKVIEEADGIPWPLYPTDDEPLENQGEREGARMIPGDESGDGF